MIYLFTLSQHTFKPCHPQLDWGPQNQCVISKVIIDTLVAKHAV